MENGWIGSSLTEEMMYAAQQNSIATCNSQQVLKSAMAVHTMNVAEEENVYPVVLLKRLFDIAGEETPSIIENIAEVETNYPQDQFAGLLARATSNFYPNSSSAALSPEDVAKLDAATSEAILNAKSGHVIQIADVIHGVNVEADNYTYPVTLLTNLFNIVNEPIPSRLTNVATRDVAYPKEDFIALLTRAKSTLESSPK